MVLLGVCYGVARHCYGVARWLLWYCKVLLGVARCC